MIRLKTSDEIKKMRRGGVLLGEVLADLLNVTRPGITTLALDSLAEEWIKAKGGYPAFKKVPGYSHTLCTCVNNQVVHAIPGRYVLKEGDVLTIDIGMYFEGLFTDTAWTIPVGTIDKRVEHFLEVGRKALFDGIKKARAGNHLKDISRVIEKDLTLENYGIVESLSGHGVGKDLHEEPLVLNKVAPGSDIILKAGMTLALEPIYTDGDPEVYLEDDDWTIVAPESKYGAVFEHSILVTSESAEILTLRPGEEIL